MSLYLNPLIRGVVPSLVAACWMGSCAVAKAQFDGRSNGYVQGTATAASERLPTRMRVQVQLTGRGPTLPAALAALKDRREAAAAVLPTMGALAESIHIGDPEVTRGEEQQKMNQMIIERMGRTKRAVKPEATQLPTTATATLTADWPLTAADVEQLITTAFDLQEKIKAADLGVAKEVAVLTPEEEELKAELEQMTYNNGPETNPGEPLFLFIAEIGAEEQAKLKADAFQKAKHDAEQLAAAAGVKLGKLSSLQGSTQSGGLDNSYSEYGGNDYVYAVMRRQAQMRRAAMPSDSEATGEAVGDKPGKVRFVVQVNATFGLE